MAPGKDEAQVIVEILKFHPKVVVLQRRIAPVNTLPTPHNKGKVNLVEKFYFFFINFNTVGSNIQETSTSTFVVENQN